MEKKLERTKLPPYVSFLAFNNFINKLREDNIPLRIDRSVMSKTSGSQFSAMIASLRFLGLVDENDVPTPNMKQLVEADENSRSSIFASLTRESYGFVFDDPNFHLDRATANQVTAKFREQGISGSTVTKSITFFLAICQAAEIKMSTHVKPPLPPRGTQKRVVRGVVKSNICLDARALDNPDKNIDIEAVGVECFEIPVPGKLSVKITVPRDLDAADWEMLQNMLVVYVNHWKKFSD